MILKAKNRAMLQDQCMDNLIAKRPEMNEEAELRSTTGRTTKRKRNGRQGEENRIQSENKQQQDHITLDASLEKQWATQPTPSDCQPGRPQPL
jgi:hypothetical protein